MALHATYQTVPEIDGHYIAVACRNCASVRYFTVTTLASTARVDVEYCSQSCQESWADEQVCSTNIVMDARLMAYTGR